MTTEINYDDIYRVEIQCANLISDRDSCGDGAPAMEILKNRKWCQVGYDNHMQEVWLFRVRAHDAKQAIDIVARLVREEFDNPASMMRRHADAADDEQLELSFARAYVEMKLWHEDVVTHPDLELVNTG